MYNPRNVFAFLVLVLAVASCDNASSENTDTSDDIQQPDAAEADVGVEPDAATELDEGVDPGDTSNADVEVREPYLRPTYAEYDPHPEPPSLLRDVAMIDDEIEFTRPFVPGHRTSMDGRIALRVQGGPPGGHMLAKQLSFWLFVPERIEAPLMAGAPGAEILAVPEPYNIDFPPALNPSVERLGHHALCDPTENFEVEGERTNPYVCGENNADDCYDLVVISTTSPGMGAQMWGTPVTIRVEAPKTADARIADITLGEAVAGIIIEQSTEFTEPAVTRDGRLLTGRLGRAPRRWTNPNTGEEFNRQYDLAYAVLPPEADPCDVRGWTTFHPMSHAPYDNDMIGRYGLAAYPFRDSEGNPIADGEDLGGTYPWVDREGANVFMAGVQGRMVEQSPEVYPRRCVVEGCEQYYENNDWDRGFLVAGLWTHGKFVHLDSMINNLDWAVGVTPSTHFMVDLYRNSDGEAVPVRLGAGRYIDDMRGREEMYPAGYTHNANVLDSLQNLPNHHVNTTPITPRDIVWIMSTGVATDEVSFDDLLDPNALIVSSMQGSVTQHYNEFGESTAVPRYWNGQVRALIAPISAAAFNVLMADLEEETHVQNGATSLDWNVPAYGHVDAGAGRIEPVALGGVVGKGFWSSGDAGIRYTIPAQSQVLRAHDWYFGIFVDVRDAGEARVLARYPDGTELHLEGRELARYVVNGVVQHEVQLPTSTPGYFHLALAIRDGNRDITFLLNGYALDRYESETPLFEMIPGEFVIGGPSGDWRGTRGWLDELRVLAYVPNVEVMCNQANGTLATAPAGSALRDQAALFPAWAHEQVAAAARSEADRFACFHNHTAEYAAHLRNLPSGTESVRERINFPEGPLRVGEPRPDSSGNAFCLSCHTVTSRGGLSLEALKYRPDILLEDDRRRQPMQPPRRVFGNIPAGWIPPGAGPGSPTESVQAPREGLLIDRWLFGEGL